jgi:hypothetical protein
MSNYLNPAYPNAGAQNLVLTPAARAENQRVFAVRELDAGQGAIIITNAKQLLGSGAQYLGEIGNPYSVRFVEQKAGKL